MKLHELISEVDINRRNFLRGLGAAGAAGALTYRASDRKEEPTSRPSAEPTDSTEPNRFVKDEPIPQTHQKTDTGANQYGSTSQHANRDAQSYFLSYAQKQGIRGVELAALMAQAAHETMGFHRLAEKGPKEYFRQYEGKLGNDKPGDGYRYRGRAYLHITGKWMYNRVGKGIGVDLVKHPELLERPDVAAKASIWFWNNIVKPNVKDFNDVIAVTARVQGGAGGLGDRATNFDDYKRKLKV